MNYLAFRIDNTSIKDHKVVHGYFVRGQKSSDYNWELLKECKDIESAKNYIKSIIVDLDRQWVYGPDGYSIKL